MKKLIMAAAIGLFSLPALAQTMTVNTGRTTFGIRAGVNFQTLNGEDADGNELEYNISTGFHAGLNAEIPVGSGFYVQPGVMYSLKGAELANNRNKIRLSYVEVPVNLVYKPILGTGNMILGFGPYVGFGVDGKYEVNNTGRDIDFVGEYEPNNNTLQLRRLDGGANFLAGYEFANKVSFQLNAQLGLLNIRPENYPNDSKLKNTGFGVSLGYRF
ncbi:MAG TPA: porin family protein [Flavisolibacter sp.]|nr:porin family protein [Flavisolibacter sp.]